MTKAFVRRCNKCSKVFLKESGCNKITCDCGNKQCYVCGTNVADYTHFDDSRRGGKCPLNGEMHDLLDEQVAVAQERTVQELLKHQAELDDDDIRVDKFRVVTNTKNVAFSNLESEEYMVPHVLAHRPTPFIHRDPRPVRTYKCFVCNKGFNSIHALSQHRTAKHENSCERCQKSFREENHLRQHMRDKHGIWRRF